MYSMLEAECYRKKEEAKLEIQSVRGIEFK